MPPRLLVFENWLRDDVFRYGTLEKTLLVSLDLADELSALYGWRWDHDLVVLDGFQVDAWLEGAYGFRVPVTIIRGWSGKIAFAIDRGHFRTAKLEVE